MSSVLNPYSDDVGLDPEMKTYTEAELDSELKSYSELQSPLDLEKEAELDEESHSALKSFSELERSVHEIKSYFEVGTAPGTYRVIDLYCLKDFLNLIMRCSCESDPGFAIFQVEQDETLLSFHSVLDIMCKHCKRKMSFGTSMIQTKAEPSCEREPDVDIRMEKILADPGQRRDLWNQLYDPQPKTFTHNSSLNICGSINPAEEMMKTELMENPTTPDLVICYGCNSIFSRNNFKLHNLHCKKINKNQFQCDFCSKSFAKQHNLKQHMRIHTGNKLNCDFEHCQRTFNDRSSMNKHIKSVHLKEKPHVCEVCQKAFSRASHLKEHLVVHSKEKKFECPVCFKRFPFLSTMNHHKQSHGEDKLFKCDRCTKSFKEKKSLKVHCINTHKIDYESFNNILALGPEINRDFLP